MSQNEVSDIIMKEQYIIKNNIIEQVQYKVVVAKYKVEGENQGLREQKKILNVKEVKGSIEDQCNKFSTAVIVMATRRTVSLSCFYPELLRYKCFC